MQLADEMAQVSNYHFRDAVQQGRMVFDYLLRPGPSPTTNALKVMAQEGLPVPDGRSERDPQRGQKGVPSSLED